MAIICVASESGVSGSIVTIGFMLSQRLPRVTPDELRREHASKEFFVFLIVDLAHCF